MIHISSRIGKDRYKVDIKSPSGNTVIADEPASVGGQDLGFSPRELLVASLAACTSATLRMYADHKGWDLQTVELEMDLERDDASNRTQIIRNLKLTGTLDETQRARLLAVANSCPVHKILSNPIDIETVLV
ncbi:MAG: OsmC family protein [Bacteroidota bacterium]